MRELFARELSSEKLSRIPWDESRLLPQSIVSPERRKVDDKSSLRRALLSRALDGRSMRGGRVKD